jgi:hypothetical protein
MVTQQHPARPSPWLVRPRREVPLAILHGLLWDWTRDLDSGQTAQFPSPDGSVLHVERAASTLRLAVVGGHRRVAFRWDAPAAGPRLVAPAGISPTEAASAWSQGGHIILELRAGGVLFRFPVPVV